MKKLVLLLVFASISCFANSQSLEIQDNCPYNIYGICITEDMGGVDVEFYYYYHEERRETQGYAGSVYMRLTNYNAFPVTVFWALEYNNYGEILEKKAEQYWGIKKKKKSNLIGQDMKSHILRLNGL